MHRVDTSGAVDGLFQDGNPAIGQLAILLAAAWLNDMQENLCHVIEQANIDLEKGVETQLYDAIVALIAGIVGDGSGAVPTTRTVTGSGLVTGGGDLAANRVLTVAIASAAEAVAMAANNKALTPASLVDLLGMSGTGNTMVLNIGAAVVQIFQGTAGANGTTILTLPESFPTECVAAFCNGGTGDTDAQDNEPFVSGVGISSVSVFNARDNSVSVRILAFGR